MDYFVLDLTKPKQLELLYPIEDVNPLEKIMFLEYVYDRTESLEILDDLIDTYKKYKRTLPRMYAIMTKKNARESIRRLNRIKKAKKLYERAI